MGQSGRTQDLRQRERQNGEENPGVADADVAEGGRDDRRDRKPSENVEFHRADAQVPGHERRRVGAHAEVGGMAERQQARVTEEQVEPQRGDGEDEAVGQELRLVKAGEFRNQQKHDHDRHAIGRQPPGRDLLIGRETGDHDAFPNIPVGRMRSTMAAMR